MKIDGCALKCKKPRISSKKLENNKWANNIIVHLKRFEYANRGPRKRHK